MTAKEAIEVLQNQLKHGVQERHEAVNMAIDSLNKVEQIKQLIKQTDKEV